MRNLSLKLLLALFLFPLLLVIGCEDPVPDKDGFGVKLWFGSNVNGFQEYHPTIQGSWVSDLPGVVLTTSIFGFNLKQAPWFQENGRSPANWQVIVKDSNPIFTPCIGQAAIGDVKFRKWNDWFCTAIVLFHGGTSISPETIVANSYNSITVTNDQITDTYGAPKVFVMNEGGVLIGEATASSCGPGWLGETIWIPSVESGFYVLMIGNMTSAGGYEDVGGKSFYIDGWGVGCDPEAQENCIALEGIWDSATCTCQCAFGVC